MKVTNFQYIVLGVFVVFIIVGAGIFATKKGSGGSGAVGKVVIWGDVDSAVMTGALDILRSKDGSFSAVNYVYKDPSQYESALIDAMASGVGPDLFLVSPESATKFFNKISVIPYSAVPQQAYLAAYVDEGSLFLTTGGPLALPITLDPLVLYWNRDMLAASGVAGPPQDWDTLIALAPRLTSVDASAVVQKSAVALGGWSNIAHAKEILLSLVMQAGDPVVARDASGAQTSVFGQAPQSAGKNPTVSALQFYTDFSNPTKTSYSWNRSLPEAGNAFVAGRLALYFGFASERQSLTERNPNLHIGVALLPQIASGGVRLTYGRMTGVAVSRTAANPSGALTIAEILGGPVGAGAFMTAAKLPPVRRDVAEDTSTDAAASVFEQSALIARAWLDPSPPQTDTIFKTMVESVISGASDSGTAVSEASQALGLFYRKNQTTQ